MRWQRKHRLYRVVQKKSTEIQKLCLKKNKNTPSELKAQLQTAFKVRARNQFPTRQAATLPAAYSSSASAFPNQHFYTPQALTAQSP